MLMLRMKEKMTFKQEGTFIFFFLRPYTHTNKTTVCTTGKKSKQKQNDFPHHCDVTTNHSKNKTKQHNSTPTTNTTYSFQQETSVFVHPTPSLFYTILHATNIHTHPYSD